MDICLYVCAIVKPKQSKINKVNNDNNNDDKNSKNRNGIMIKVVLNGLQTLRNIELFLQSGADIIK